MTLDVENPNVLKFVPFSSCINTSFWYELNRIKLEDYKLNDDFKSLKGPINGMPPIMNFDYSSFQNNTNDFYNVNNKTIHIKGLLKVFNTINEFNMLDKNKLIDQLGQDIWSDIKSDKAVNDPSLLIKFCLITFANLKSYIFHYWFSFPAISFPEKSYFLRKLINYNELFDPSKTENLLSSIHKFQQNSLEPQIFFAVDYNTLEVISVKEGISIYNSNKSRVLFSFCDPNSSSNFPGWPLRNYLALLSSKCKKSNNDAIIEIFAFRDRYVSGTRNIENSLIFCIQPIETNHVTQITTIGWERNEKNQLHPRVVDMSSSMNTEKLAESAVNLNLKLMKWRIAPDIDLDIIKNQKCLLLGSGTLGCNVARCLMAWGVETITFVDNSKVSYSNPVRQSLFFFQDSINKQSNENFKSIKAAENLKLIYPSVKSKGVVLNIPMPGHRVSKNMQSKVKDDIGILTDLILTHDCIFLLMDTRESRWLPTVIAAAQKKLVINSALGFDSFLVMRHGIKTGDPLRDFPVENSIPSSSKIPSNLLGCYFCNDIVAPGNSTLDRTLDQQCTVSRPGLSMIASAMAVEMMVTILQHPMKYQAYSDTNNDFENTFEESSLGIVPHQIRGYLHSYTNILPASRAFDKCTACSNQIIDTFNRDGFEFLIRVFNDSTYLEDITGLKELKIALDETDTDFCADLND